MGKFILMVLPYAIDALEPVISKQTLEFHHGKHLAGYVNNLNGLLPGSGFEEASLEEIVCKATGGMLNNVGQILNHNMYFEQFCSPKADNAPTGKLAEAIVRDFGSFEAFKEAFQKSGATLFGSGWVWVSADKDGKKLKPYCIHLKEIFHKNGTISIIGCKGKRFLFYENKCDEGLSK